MIDYDVVVADAHGALFAHVRRQGIPHAAHDLIIAATAAPAGRQLITADLAALDSLPGVDFLLHRRRERQWKGFAKVIAGDWPWISRDCNRGGWPPLEGS